MSTHLPIQILSFLVLLPATQATKYLGVPVLQQLIARMPWLCSFFLAVVGRGRCRIFYSFGSAQSAVFYGDFTPFTILRRRSIGSRGSRSPLCGRHTCPRIYPCSDDDWIFTNDHPGLFGFRHSSRYLDSLQFPSQRQMARKISGHAQIPSLAPYFSKKNPSTRISQSIFPWIDKIFWDLLLSRGMAGKLRPGPAKKISPSFLGQNQLNPSSEKKKAVLKGLARPRERLWVTARPCSSPSPGPDVFITFTVINPKSYFGFVVA